MAALVTVVLLASDAGAQTLPAGWTATNVGNPALAGSASASGNTVTVDGAGADIWDSADQFMFVHRPVSGDGDVVARVESLLGAHEWSKAGVMIRESLAPGAKHAMVVASDARGIAFQRRSTTNGSSAHTGAPGTEPVWLKLSRRGSTFTASRSGNGVAWSTFASVSIGMSADVLVGLAITSHNTSARATARFSGVEWQSFAPPLPAGWSSSDIGSPAVAGSATSPGTGAFRVTGAGADIWGPSDQFRFVYRAVSGDVDVVARVTQVQRAHEWSKAGVMVRSSLAASSAHGFMLVSAGRGSAFQRRQAPGAVSLNTSAGSGQAPMWVKIERRGTTLTAYRSSDGTNWIFVDTDTLPPGDAVYVGLAVTSHNPPAASTAAFESVTVTPVGPTANQPPTVSLTSPASGATYAAPASIAVAATAADADGSVVTVAFYVNGSQIVSDAAPPYAVTWIAVAAGTYAFTAVARDDSGNTTVSSTRLVTVTEAPVPGGTAGSAASAQFTR